jgi:hypothetical protein
LNVAQPLMVRVSALVVTLALALASPSECAGWLSTPEARMACCTDEATCPMHSSEAVPDGSPRAISQAEADGCCAASERDDSASSSTGFVLSLPTAPVADVLPQVVPPVAPSLSVWRTLVPHVPPAVPTHLRLSVLLV